MNDARTIIGIGGTVKVMRGRRHAAEESKTAATAAGRVRICSKILCGVVHATDDRIDA